MRKRIHKGQSFDKVQKAFPTINKEQFNIFKDSLNDPTTLLLREWGKDMQRKNIGHHKLGSSGYLGKRPVGKGGRAI